MSLLTATLSLFKRTPAKVAKRQYAAAITSRLTEGWLAPVTTADSELSNAAQTLRARARELERNNEYVRRWLRILENNVVGHRGIAFQSKIKDPTGTYDVLANRAVEEAWYRWGMAENVSPSGTLSWVEIQLMILRRVAVDGAVLVRKIKSADSVFGFQIQIIEIDRLDSGNTKLMPDGSEIRFGIERNKFGKPVAYHVTDRHPGDVFLSATSQRVERIPASEIIHLYRPERPGQTIGAPWCSAVMVALENLAKYAEAELYAARIASCQMGFFTSQTPDGWSGDGVDSAGNPTIDAEPGAFHKLAPGEGFTSFNPTHPTTAFADFIKGQLRKIASGLGVSYVALANDFESVNYSSARSSLLEEREEFKTLQEWFIHHLILPIWNEWLPAALLTGQIKNSAGNALPFTKLAKFNAPEFRGKRWDWVDPEKDINAAEKAMRLGLQSRREIVAARGGDLEDVLEEQEADLELAKARGVVTPEEIARVEISKQRMDAYGVGVRAGCITPNLDDETALRASTELPAPSTEVAKSWAIDGGSRKPITLQSGKVATPNPSQPMQPQPAPAP